MAKVLGFSPKDVDRIGRAVRDFESRPARLPIAEGRHEKSHGRMLIAVPREEEDEDGYCLGDLYLHNAEDNSYELLAEDVVKIAVLPDTL